MTPDFSPEDIAAMQRALLALDAGLLLLGFISWLFGFARAARLRESFEARFASRRYRHAIWIFLGALIVFGAAYAAQHALVAWHFPEPYLETLTPGFARPTLLAVTASLIAIAISLAVTFRLRREEPSPSARSVVEALLVPAAYLTGLSVVYLSLSLVDLELWAGFKRAAFYSAAVFALPVALLPGAWRARGLPVVLSLFFLVVFGDLIYLRYFGNILPVLAISSGGQIWDVRDIIVKYTQRGDAWLLLVLGASAGLAFSWPRAARTDASLLPRASIVGTTRALGTLQSALLVLTCVAWLMPVPRIVQSWLESDRSWRVLNGTDAVQDSGIVVAHIKEIARSLRDAREHGRISKPDFEKLRAYHAARAAREKESRIDPDFGRARGSNLLILQVEAMQKWVIGAHVRGQELTPFLNRLRERTWFFDRLYDETGDSSTSDCEYMVLNSQFPIPQGSVAFRRDEDHFVTLLHAFKDVGYTTFAGHAYAAGMWNRAVLYPKYGFDQTAFRDELGDGPKLGWGIGDKLFFQRVVPRIERLKTPFVSLLITLTSHGPYQYVPAAERKLTLGAIENTDFGGYLHSMRYNDEAIEQLFTELERDHLLENTTIVIYGDHDSRMKFYAPLAAETDLAPDTQRRLAIRDYTTKQIPLFVVLPERLHAGAREVHTLGGQVDIGATIVHLFGLARPGSFIGQSLVPERAGHASRIDGSGVDEHHIYIAPGGGRCESFPDLQRLPRADCAELRAQTQEELNMSWNVTLLDLAPRLAGKTPDKAAAKR